MFSIALTAFPTSVFWTSLAAPKLVTIAVAKQAATTVLAANIDPRRLRNGHSAGCGVQWRGYSVFTVFNLVGKPVEVDVLLAGDVFATAPLPIFSCYEFLELTGKGVSVLVEDPGRVYLLKQRLHAETTYQSPVTRVLEDSEVKKTTV